MRKFIVQFNTADYKEFSTNRYEVVCDNKEEALEVALDYIVVSGLIEEEMRNIFRICNTVREIISL